MGGLCRKEGGARGLFPKEKRGFFSDRDTFCGEGNGQECYNTDCLFVLRGMSRAHMTEHLSGVDQENSRSVKIMFLGETEPVLT